MYQTEPGLLDNQYHLTVEGESSDVQGLFPWSIDEFILFTTLFFRFQYRDELDFFRNSILSGKLEESRSAEPECTHKYMRIRAPYRRTSYPQNLSFERSLLSHSTEDSPPLLPAILTTIKKGGDLPVINRLAFSGLSPHAQSGDYRDHLHINEDFIILEAVDENYQPVPEGQKAAKILITNLFHQTMPLFRYELEEPFTILT